MIRNVIFDVGRVLLCYEPADYLRRRYPQKIADTLLETIFESGEWLELDRGTITVADAVGRFVARRPELAHSIEQVMHNWCELMTPLEGSLQLLEALEKRGLRLYYLSNMAQQSAQDILSRFDFWKRFQGGIFSYELHRLKPETEIYQHLFRRFELHPEECVFLDDSPANIDAGRRLAMEGIVFESAEDASNQLWNRFGIPV